nr:threonine synthase [Helicobacteraceae bacterium]
NENNVLTELIQTGKYDMRNKALIATTSPAMDILKSSNVERVLYTLFGAERTKELMAELDNNKFYQLTADELSAVQELFVADYCSGDEGKAYIKKVFKEEGYLMDPHTATCLKAYDTCCPKPLKSIIYSTAEWTKFSPTIANALTGEVDTQDIDALKSIAKEANIEIPEMINGLFNKAIVQDTVIEKEDIEKEILAFI